MKKRILLLFPCLVLLAGLFVSCSESTEEGTYSNWQARNEAFIDSIKGLNPTQIESGDTLAVAAVPAGELFSLFVKSASTTTDKLTYIYCKKIKANAAGRRPLYSESVNVFYYGTMINGTEFDGNFKGYSALDQTFSAGKEPTEFDSTTPFKVNGGVLGFNEALQYMRTGERWMVYIPWKLGYGSIGKAGIPGYSTLTFDLDLISVDD